VPNPWYFNADNVAQRGGRLGNAELLATAYVGRDPASYAEAMKPSSSIARCLQALMGSLMERGDERSRSGYDGLIRSLMGSVIDGKRSRFSHQGLMRSLMEIMLPPLLSPLISTPLRR